MRNLLVEKSWVQILLAIAMFSAVNGILHFTQSPIEFHEGKGWDGEAYYNMAEQFAQGVAIQDRAPFVYRPGLPWLVGQFFPNDLIHGFFLLNLGANFVSVLLLVFLLRPFIRNPWVILALLLAFMIPWISPIRYIHFYPCYTDCFGMTFTLAGLLVLTRMRRKDEMKKAGWLGMLILAVIVGFGVLFREYVFLLALVAPFVSNPLKINKEEPFFKSLFKALQTGVRNEKAREGVTLGVNEIVNMPNLKRINISSFLPLVVGIAGLLITRENVSGITNEFSFGYIATLWLLFKSIFSFLHSWAIVVGPIIVVLIYFWKEARATLLKHQGLWAFLILGSLLAYIGGADTERFVFWLFPVILILLGQLLEKHGSLFKNPVLWITIVVGQVLSWRLIANIPQFEEGKEVNPVPLLGPYIDADSLQLFSHHAGIGFKFVSMVEYAVLIGILYFVLDRVYHLAANGGKKEVES